MPPVFNDLIKNVSPTRDIGFHERERERERDVDLAASLQRLLPATYTLTFYRAYSTLTVLHIYISMLMGKKGWTIGWRDNY